MQPLAENAVNVPAFLNKLWKMVNDPGTDHLICWSPAGNSFHIQNQAQFWYELLPLYYKHNNMSSFVRQLNMYGFHKMSVFENGTMDSDKDEIQFFHPFFQRGKPELLRNIKRKVTASKLSGDSLHSAIKSDELLKVLDDVKQLRGRQANVDSQLSTMKHENAVLWRELAMLRQKHIKQQQIVNKLIQFLVTCVHHPRHSGLSGLKRRYPLMLSENPSKKQKSTTSSNSEGPTIHELDNAEVLSDELFADESDSLAQPESAPISIQVEKVQSPLTPHSSTSNSAGQQRDENPSTPSTTRQLLDDAAVENMNSEMFWDTPEFVYIKPEELMPEVEIDDEAATEAANNSDTTESPDSQKVFLNPTARDTLLSDLVNGSYNRDVINGSKGSGRDQTKKQMLAANQQTVKPNMTVATRDAPLAFNRLNSVEDLDVHVESTQSELEQLKDILNGYNTLDANALLGSTLQLFNDDAPDYGLTYTQQTGDTNHTQTNESGDALCSGSELTTYEPNSELIDFTELFDDSVDAESTTPPPDLTVETPSSSVSTPQVVAMSAPTFPVTGGSSKKKSK